METQDLFLVFGEKCQELQESGHTPFFSFSGHVKLYHFQVYRGEYHKDNDPVIDIYSYHYSSIGDYLQDCLNKSNLLMLE